MAKALLTREQWIAKHGWDPEGEDHTPKAWTGITPEDSRPKDYKGPTTAKPARMLLTREQWIDKHGTDPETGERALNESSAKAVKPGTDGQIPLPSTMDKLKAAFNPRDVSNDVGALGSSFNENFAFGIPAKAMDALGLESQAKRDAMKEASPVGDFIGRGVGAGMDIATGPAKVIQDAVSTGARAIAPKVTGNLTGALLRTGESAAQGAAIEGARAQVDGDDAETILKKAGVGAGGATVFHGVAAVPGAVRKAGQALGKGAANRVDERIIDGLTSGGTGKQQTKILGDQGLNRGRLLETAKETPGLAKAAAAKNTTKTQEILEKTTKGLNESNQATYKAVEAVSPGEDFDKVYSTLEKTRDALKQNPHTVSLANEVDQKMNHLLTAWGDKKFIPVSELRQYATDMGPKAFKSIPGVDIGAAEKVGRGIYRDMVTLAEDHIAANAARAGLPKNAVETLRANNKRLSNLIDVETALDRRANMELQGKKTAWERIKDASSTATGLVGVATAIGSGNISHVPAALAAAGALRAAPAAMRAADSALARLVSAKRGGADASTLKELATLAIRSGVAPATVSAVSGP